MMSTYGHQIESSEDEYVHLAKEATDLVSGAGSTGSVLDLIPIREYYYVTLQYFPL